MIYDQGSKQWKLEPAEAARLAAAVRKAASEAMAPLRKQLSDLVTETATSAAKHRRLRALIKEGLYEPTQYHTNGRH